MPGNQEDKFVKVIKKAADELLRSPLHIKRSASLLYQITVNNMLEVTVDPQNPKRGQSAFQTDLCVFEEVSMGVFIPRVVMEFKTGVSTHDILTYNTKAGKHKQIYPYLRYGIFSSRSPTVPGRFFTHNQWLDFFVALGSYPRKNIKQFLRGFLRKEIKSSRLMEKIASGKTESWIYQKGIFLKGKK